MRRAGVSPAGGDRLRDELAALGSVDDAAIDLAEAALLLAARANPGKDPDVYRDHLAALVAGLAARAAANGDTTSATSRAALAAAELAGGWRYHGDVADYDDAQNCDLMRVIDRRRGLPVALGILYLHALRAQGWTAGGLAFPAHFLIRVDGAGGDRVIIDPFHDGKPMEVRDLRALLKAVAGPEAELSRDAYAPLGNRDILARLQNNAKLRHLEAGRLDRALAAVEDMLLIAPADHRLWREAGLMHMRLGDLDGAIAALDRYLALAPPGADRQRIEQVLHELHQRLT